MRKALLARQGATILVAVSLLATACGGSDSKSEPGANAPTKKDSCTAEAPKSDLTMATFVAPKGLDPQTAATSGRTGAIELAAIYDTLIAYDPSSGSFQPQVAKSLKPTNDYGTWTLTLRDGIKFGNGDPLDATAVKSSISRHLIDKALNGSLAETIASMATPNSRTVVFTLTDPWAEFPFVLSGPIGMIANPALVEERGDGFQSDPRGAGVGPFEVERYASGEELVLNAKPDYWGGPVCINKLRFTTINDAHTAIGAFQNREVDVAFLQDPQIIAEAKSAGTESFGFKYGMGRSIVMNAGARGTTPPTADVRLRRAVALALDTELIDQRSYQGNGYPTSAIFSKDMNSWSGVQGPEFDATAARKLVANVKAEGKWNGGIRLVCPQLSEEASIATEALLKDVGFDVAREIVDTSTLVERVIKNVDYDLACWQFNISDFAPWVSLEAFRSDSSSNRGGYKNPEMDAAISQLKIAATEKERRTALGAIQRLWNETAPSANYAINQDTILWQDSVSGLDFSSESIVTFGNAVVRGR